MGWSRHDEESRADHYRDERKHDFPLRLKPKISPALEVAIAVKNCANVLDGAKLVEAYAADRVSARLLDIKAAALESPLTPASFGGES